MIFRVKLEENGEAPHIASTVGLGSVTNIESDAKIKVVVSPSLFGAHEEHSTIAA
jgi:hypothetical protein